MEKDIEKDTIKENVHLFRKPEYLYKLSKPFQFEGENYTEIFLDLDELSGSDMINAERQFNSDVANAQTFIPVKELSKGYQAIIASMAGKVPVEFINALPAKDFAKITTKVQSFFLGSA